MYHWCALRCRRYAHEVIADYLVGIVLDVLPLVAVGEECVDEILVALVKAVDLVKLGVQIRDSRIRGESEKDRVQFLLIGGAHGDLVGMVLQGRECSYF